MYNELSLFRSTLVIKDGSGVQFILHIHCFNFIGIRVVSFKAVYGSMGALPQALSRSACAFVRAESINFSDHHTILQYSSLQNRSLFYTYLLQAPMSLWKCITTEGLHQISDAEAVRLFGTSFQTELDHLKHANTTVEAGMKEAAGSLGNGKQTPSRFLFGNDFDEVNRTLVSMLALRWVLADDYSSFIAGQAGSSRQQKLTRESFRHLRQYFSQRLPDNDSIYALLVATVIDDIGKDPRLADILAKKRNNGSAASDYHHANHSELVLESAKAGIIPALENLSSPTNRAAILQSLEIGGKLNVAQLVQGEDAPASLAILRTIAYGPGFHMRAMVTILDVAGAGAHRDARGCIVMTESVYQAYMSTIEIMEGFINGSIPSERECYDRVLRARGETLHKKGFDHLSTESDEERALLRLLCMGRVDTKELADCFRSAFMDIPPISRKDLVQGMSVDGLGDGVAIVPYYAPGLLAEVMRCAGKMDDDSDRRIKALSAFLQFLARVFASSKRQLGTMGAVLERDLSFAQDVIKSRHFVNDPSILMHVELPW